MRLLGVILSVFVSSTIAANNFFGITAANAVGGKTAYTCRTQSDWNKLAQTAKENGFKSIRIVGFDCEALDRASKAAASVAIQVLAGIFITGTVASSSSRISKEVEMFRKAYATYGASRYVGLTVGNEVNDSTSKIMQKVYDVRSYLRSVGVTTPVSTVHTWVRIRDDPALCGADFVGANAHAFFDTTKTSSQAGELMYQIMIPALKKKCPGKKLMITETGWPSRGNRNGKAAVSVADERTALLKINCVAKGDSSVALYAFEADDQMWKHNDNEGSFGIFGKITLKNDVFAASC